MSPGATVAPVSCGERCRCLREGRGLRGRCGDPGLCISGVPQEPIAQSPQNSLSPACSGWSLLEGAASPLQVSSQCRPRLPHLTRLARQGGRARRRFGRWGQRGGAPSLTSAVGGVEEAQGHQGARHQEQQQQQPPLQEASVLLSRPAGNLHHPYWAFGLPHHQVSSQGKVHS